ncbi:MAG TPA: hypothetical protein VN700_15955 [Vicinamibacterales bacterium]|nr:hypothetical protein [Vicinamibacterales bacterium]
MADRQNLDIDERERIREHESVKADVRRQVHSEIAQEVRATDADRAREKAAAESMKRQAMEEVAGTERELSRSRVVARGSQVIDYLFYIVYGIIGVAIALAAVGAREGAGFTRFVNTLAGPLTAPFRNILTDPASGNSRFMFSYGVALVAYLLLHLAINGFLRILAQRKTEI